jgi:hydrogenase nickel incorporation protein HypA/HybF
VHEMSLVEGMRTILEDQARAHAVDRITRVRVEIGRFAGVENRRWNSPGTWSCAGRPRGAELVMLDLPGRAMCFDCATDVEIENRLDPCPTCGGGKLMPTGGEEMRIKDLEAV